MLELPDIKATIIIMLCEMKINTFELNQKTEVLSREKTCKKNCMETL